MSTAGKRPSPGQQPKRSGIGDEISLFTRHIGALQAALPTQWVMTTALTLACAKNYNDFLQKNGEPQGDSKENFNLGADHFLEYNRLWSRLQKAEAATAIIPQTFVVALISQYDSFLGGLLRCLYRTQPGLLQQSDTKLTYSQLCEFNDIEQAKEDILEKEIEDTLRKSHHEQFDWMENKFKTENKSKLPLRDGLAIWPVFVELTQRRNLFAHCDGKVSAQYLIVCDKYDVNYGKRPSPGDRLDVTPHYFYQAHDCVFEIGTKLGHVLWRKGVPEERAEADNNLLMLGFDLLVAGHYALAVTLGVFALKTLKKHCSESVRRRMAINLAQAYKWLGKPTEAAEIINDEDWSSCDAEFHLAVAVLRDDFGKAAGLMKTLAAADLMQKNAYRDWPLLKEFRKSQAFLDAYQSIYGHPMVPIEPSPEDSLFGPVSKLLANKPAPGPQAAGKTLPEQPNGKEGHPPA